MDCIPPFTDIAAELVEKDLIMEALLVILSCLPKKETRGYRNEIRGLKNRYRQTEFVRKNFSKNYKEEWKIAIKRDINNLLFRIGLDFEVMEKAIQSIYIGAVLSNLDEENRPCRTRNEIEPSINWLNVFYCITAILLLAGILYLVLK